MTTEVPPKKTVREIQRAEFEKFLALLLRDAKKVVTAEEFAATRKAKRQSDSGKAQS